jgi:hypothetical protein
MRLRSPCCPGASATPWPPSCVPGDGGRSARGKPARPRSPRACSARQLVGRRPGPCRGYQALIAASRTGAARTHTAPFEGDRLVDGEDEMRFASRRARFAMNLRGLAVLAHGRRLPTRSRMTWSRVRSGDPHYLWTVAWPVTCAPQLHRSTAGDRDRAGAGRRHGLGQRDLHGSISAVMTPSSSTSSVNGPIRAR